MNEKKISLETSIKMAIDLEKRGQQFYRKAAEKTDNESGKRIFKMLAREEALHLDTFQKMLEELDAVHDWQYYVKGYPPQRRVPLFDEDQTRKTKQDQSHTDELVALRTAMDHERKAIAFFDSLLSKSEDAISRQVIEFIKEQEVFHYDLLQAEIDNITNTGFWFDEAEFRMDGKF